MALTKPRIVELLLVTTVPTMIVAAGGLPSLWLIAATVVGGALAAGGANTVNMLFDPRHRRAHGARPGTGPWSPARSGPARLWCSPWL